jgi:hypothetical protein
MKVIWVQWVVMVRPHDHHDQLFSLSQAVLRRRHRLFSILPIDHYRSSPTYPFA